MVGTSTSASFIGLRRVRPWRIALVVDVQPRVEQFAHARSRRRRGSLRVDDDEGLLLAGHSCHSASPAPLQTSLTKMGEHRESPPARLPHVTSAAEAEDKEKGRLTRL